jgi:hypothetical protein
MFKRIALTVVALLVVLIAAVLLMALTKPDSFGVQRTASIKAPPEKIFALISDYHSWGSWSPYEQKDPAMKKIYSGAPSGRGAVYEWEGNSSVGKGRMEITDSSPASKVTIKLDFEKPLEGHDIAEFTLQPAGDSTNVTWAMRGPSPYITKVMSVVFNLDRMIGSDFESGLANLKALSEK